MYRRIAPFTIMVLMLLLSGCNGVSLDYLRARASYLLSKPTDTPAILIPTATFAPTKLVTLQPETSTPSAPDKKRTPNADQYEQPVYGKINANPGEATVNVRGRPNVMGDPIATLSDGQVVEVIGRSPRGEWWKVKVEGLEGWVYSAFVTVDNPQAVPCISFNSSDCGT